MSAPPHTAEAAAPTGINKHIAKLGIGFDLPSAAWSVNDLGPDSPAISVNRGDVFVGLTVDRLPGVSESILGNFTSGLPGTAKMTKETITTLGPLTGTGTRLIAVVPPPDAGRLECVLFFPNSPFAGYYIATVLGGPPNKEYTDDLAFIIASLRKDP